MLDERAAASKRKLSHDGIPIEEPLQVRPKKTKVEHTSAEDVSQPAIAEKRRAQRLAKKEKAAAARTKKERRKQTKPKSEDVSPEEAMDDLDMDSSSTIRSPIFSNSAPSASSSISSAVDAAPSSSVPLLAADSPILDGPSPTTANGSTPAGSATVDMVLPNKTTPTKEQHQARTEPDKEQAKRRLQARIDELRNARKAPGSEGSQAQSRQELLDTRRRKEEARKAHKKELRRKAKEEEARQKSENLAAGSPLMSPGSPRTPVSEHANDFQFGRVEFGDGSRTTADLGEIRTSKLKPKGPSDPATALIAVQKQQARLSGLDEGKKAEIAEKDVWLNARKRAQGERIRDNASLLKKTLQRKQKQKKKSEKDWNNRIEGVKKTADARQKKRETNLAKRKEEKGVKGKKKPGKAKARPGFEGSFRAKSKPDGPRRR